MVNVSSERWQRLVCACIIQVHVVLLWSVLPVGLWRLLHRRVRRVEGSEIHRRTEVRHRRRELRALVTLVQDRNPRQHSDRGLLYDCRKGCFGSVLKAAESYRALAASVQRVASANREVHQLGLHTVNYRTVRRLLAARQLQPDSADGSREMPPQ